MRLGRRRIVELFEDPGRFGAFSRRACGLLVDFSRERLDAGALEALFALARAQGVEATRDAMIAGEPVNATEGRAALHVALRDRTGRIYRTGGAAVNPQIAETMARMRGFARRMRMSGAVDDIVHIGIGGSDLGPRMAARALAPYHDGPRLHFVSNIDGADLTDALRPLDPARTLFIVASKTFTTLETMTNARSALAWAEAAMGGAAARARFVAITANDGEAADFGVPPERVFGFWDWVGGRYSLWSAIGLSLMIGLGPRHFDALLDGAAAMDRHFETAPMQRNLPILMGLVGVWRRNALGLGTRAVLPYDHRLALFPDFLQQLDMESNGKSTLLDGSPSPRATGPVVWGGPAATGQHAFFQLLHQGADPAPVEFLVGAQGHEPDLAHHHAILAANCLAQAEALMRGRSVEEAERRMLAAGASAEDAARLAPHRACPGDRPSTVIAYPKLTPKTLGSLVALYEHRVFVEAALWGINPFDQWGVELGKEVASGLLPALEGHDGPQPEASARGLLDALRAMGRE